jgi:hypothetical protein
LSASCWGGPPACAVPLTISPVSSAVAMNAHSQRRFIALTSCKCPSQMGVDKQRFCNLILVIMNPGDDDPGDNDPGDNDPGDNDSSDNIHVAEP